ncbi:hypothetical protein WMY93_022474 [Mugilogobius chulae]|uniref:TOG domain-containing protein n=1 Tax=Mugilogobius chulae TaxID=88201 RepID=A0AAW0NH88_9GOBI
MESISEDDGWEFVNLGDQQSFGIKTAGLEEKATACQMLVCYAKELKEGLWITLKTWPTSWCSAQFYFHDDILFKHKMTNWLLLYSYSCFFYLLYSSLTLLRVRVAAAESMPLLLECAQVRGPQYLSDMWKFMSDPLIKAIGTEPDSTFYGCLDKAQFEELGGILKGKLEEHFKNQRLRQGTTFDTLILQREDEDYDEQVEETLQDEDENDVYILTKVSDILHSIFSSHKENVLWWFEQLLPLIIELLRPERPWADRQWGLCIFDDVIEHCSPSSFKYADYFLGSMLQSLTDPVPEVRQAAAYGVGVMAQYGGANYCKFCKEAIPRLEGVIRALDSRSKENVNATENCISAVGKVMRFQPEWVNVNEMLNEWLKWLPLKRTRRRRCTPSTTCATSSKGSLLFCLVFKCKDVLKVRSVFSNNPIVLGLNYSNLPSIFQIIADGVASESIKCEDACSKRLANVIRQVQGSEGLFTQCISTLNEVQQKAIHDLLRRPDPHFLLSPPTSSPPTPSSPTPSSPTSSSPTSSSPRSELPLCC